MFIMLEISTDIYEKLSKNSNNKPINISIKALA